jgi:cardiolipin synthase
MKKVTNFLTIANTLTLFRIGITPFLIYAIFQGDYYQTLILLILGGLSDLFDGFCARQFDECSELGEILDPLADKIFLSGLCFSLIFTTRPLFIIPTWFVTIVMIRDGLLLWTGLFILKNGCRVSLKPSLWGKLSTALLMIGITFLCFQQIIAWHIIEFNTFFWILCALFNISSGLHYFIRGGLMLLKRA